MRPAFSQYKRWYSTSVSSVRVNGTAYAKPRPNTPVVAVLLDGSAQEYIDAATTAGCMPHWNRILRRAENPGCWGVVAGVMPSFTNPNNVGVMTGVTPKVHGICGNYFWNEETQKEVMMTDPSFLRANSIWGALSQQTDTKVVVVTVKDKLKRLLSHELSDSSISFSVEHAANEDVRLALQQKGINLQTLLARYPPPGVYDPDSSVACLDIGQQLIKKDMEAGRVGSSFYYLSTTDYVQHKHRPGTPEANEFYQKLDAVLGGLDAMGAVIGVTADHGMNDKIRYNGEPRAVFVETLLEEAKIEARVILPITDPYVVHHASLGSYATVYLKDKSRVMEAMTLLRRQNGLYTVMNKEEAVKTFDLPADRTGDIVIVGDRDTVVGRSAEAHDFSQVRQLRSHGGLEEQTCPIWFNVPLLPEYFKRISQGKARNFHLCDFLLNGIDHARVKAQPR